MPCLRAQLKNQPFWWQRIFVVFNLYLNISLNKDIEAGNLSFHLLKPPGQRCVVNGCHGNTSQQMSHMGTLGCWVSMIVVLETLVSRCHVPLLWKRQSACYVGQPLIPWSAAFQCTHRGDTGEQVLLTVVMETRHLGFIVSMVTFLAIDFLYGHFNRATLLKLFCQASWN